PVGAQVAALLAATEKEIQGDGVQQQARQPASADQAEGADQPQGEQAAALAPLLPAAAHGAATSPEASSVSPRSTRKRQRGAAPSSSTRAASPGSSGATNFTCGRRSGPSGPCAASMAASTWSRTTTPGTIGRPGKCPGRQGWDGATVNCMEAGRISGPAVEEAHHRGMRGVGQGLARGGALRGPGRGQGRAEAHADGAGADPEA